MSITSINPMVLNLWKHLEMNPTAQDGTKQTHLTRIAEVDNQDSYPSSSLTSPIYTPHFHVLSVPHFMYCYAANLFSLYYILL